MVSNLNMTSNESLQTVSMGIMDGFFLNPDNLNNPKTIVLEHVPGPLLPKTFLGQSRFHIFQLNKQ